MNDHDKDIAKFIQATDEVDIKSESEYSVLFFSVEMKTKFYS